MRFKRRRPDRPDPTGGRRASGLELLERRELLSHVSPSAANYYAPWVGTDLAVSNPITHKAIPFSIRRLQQDAIVNPQASFLSNEGKIVSGKDRQGNEWTITVHGPGEVIVTDTTPNDGVLDDDIDTIQLIGTNPHRTYVTGQTVASFKTATNGTVLFNRLIDTSGVNSIVLNGFSLSPPTSPLPQPIPIPPAGVNPTLFLTTGVYLTGGVHDLEFHDILARPDINSVIPTQIIIGDPATPLPKQIQPVIRLDHIYNTVPTNNAPTTATLTTPSVNLVVNGALKSFDFISATENPPVDPSQALRPSAQTTRVVNPTNTPIFIDRVTNPPLAQAVVLDSGHTYAFPQFATPTTPAPTLGTTGRTAVQATGIGTLNVHGAATNFTASKGAVPFQNGLSGLGHLKQAHFHGPADGVGLDVAGPVGSLAFDKGLGNPAGTSISAANLGTPPDQTGAPAAGLIGGLVTSTSIHHVTAHPANVTTQIPSNPDFIQYPTNRYTYYVVRQGNALTSAAIVSSGNVGGVAITGQTVNSEVKTGFHYPSFAAGLEGTRARSHIAKARVNGDLVNGVVSSSFRTGSSRIYHNPTNVVGPGSIRGKYHGVNYVTGGVTPLGNRGAGFHARKKSPGLNATNPPSRTNSLLNPIG